MRRPSFSIRYLVAFVGLAVLALAFVSLGNWQLGRAAERDAIARAIEQGRRQAPLELAADTPADALVPWRPAQATGTLRHDLTVLVDNRMHDGRPGYWVATPLLLPPADQRHAVLVLQGWIPRSGPGPQAQPALPTTSGPVTVRGELLEHVPRLFELWSFSGSADVQLPARLPDPSRPMPVVQNVPLDAYAAASGLKLLPIVLAQTAPTSPDDSGVFQRQWPEPSLDSDKNRGYALQWFGFTAIAVIAWLALAWHVLFRRKRPPQSS